MATKKVAPYTESAIEKGASKYSKACKAVKYNPSVIVKARACKAEVWLFSVTAWCAQVTVTPEARRMAVFSRGIWNGLKGVKAVGGQQLPSSIVLFNLL